MLIIGCGYLGRILGARLLSAGHPVTGVVASRASALHLDKIGITPVVADLDQPEAALPLAGAAKIFYFAPPPNEGVTDLRLAKVLGQLRGQNGTLRIVYTSTTGVYGDCQGDWVDETRPVQATTDRSRRRLDAEKQLLNWSQQTGGEVILLRVAGIYGSGRLPLDRLRQGAPMVNEAEAPWSNRIHADDLATVCAAAMDRGTSGEIYNVADGTPGNMAEYYSKVADWAGLPPPRAISMDEARKVMPPGLLSYLQESRRLDNRKMLLDLGVTLKYPDLNAGLAAHL